MEAHPLTMGTEMIQFILAFGQVAQLVEQRTENPRAEGSSPPLTTMKTAGQRLVTPLTCLFFSCMIVTCCHLAQLLCVAFPPMRTGQWLTALRKKTNVTTNVI